MHPYSLTMLMQNPIRYAFALVGLTLVSLFAHAGSMTLSSPSNGATVTSPFTVKASATSSYTITGYKIYLDGSSVYSTTSSSVSTSISASTGSHKLTVKAWDKTGASFSQSISVSVSGTSTSTSTTTSSSTSIPSNATSFSKVESMSGWSSCTTCAGGGANAVYSITQFQSSPSMDGSSTKIFLGGTTPFSHALMWRRMGNSTSASHFVFDMYYYIDYPSNSQGLEFAANQMLNNQWYKFSTQCSFAGNQWRVWDSKNSAWANTGISCARPAARTWQHVVFEYQRYNGKALFVAITVNGTKHYVNKSFYPQAKSGTNGDIGIHFQVDGNSTQADYTTWIDKLSFYYW